jgi:hypothetical protein
MRYLESISTFYFYKNDMHMVKNEGDFIVLLLRHVDKIRLGLGCWPLNLELYKKSKDRPENLINNEDRQLARDGEWFRFNYHIKRLSALREQRLILDQRGNVYSLDTTWLGKEEFIRNAYPDVKLVKISDAFKPPLSTTE